MTTLNPPVCNVPFWVDRVVDDLGTVPDPWRWIETEVAHLGLDVIAVNVAESDDHVRVPTRVLNFNDLPDSPDSRVAQRRREAQALPGPEPADQSRDDQEPTRNARTVGPARESVTHEPAAIALTPFAARPGPPESLSSCRDDIARRPVCARAFMAGAPGTSCGQAWRG